MEMTGPRAADAVDEHGKDAQDLSGFGYRPQLTRTLGAFSSFAASFSALSLMTGLFQVWFIGYAFGGPGFFWFWPIVFAGQLMVALVFAELAARYPLAGAAYQWARHLAGRAWGWGTGWLYLAAQLVTFPALVVAYQLTLPQLSSVFVFSHNFSKNAVILGLILLVITTIVNLVSVKFLARLNNLGVIAEILGALALIILLLAHIHRGPGVVFKTNGTGAGHSWGYFGAFLVSGFMALYNMYAFDTASTLAEETENPRYHAPRAVLRSLITVGLLGMVILLLSLMAIPNLSAPALSTIGLPYVLQSTMGNTVAKAFLIDVTLAITVCGLAIQAWSARTLFAMGRDQQLPFSRMLGRVSHNSHAPAVPVLVTALIGALILLINLGNPKAFNAIVALGIIFIYLAYLGVTIAALRKRRHGWPSDGGRAAGLFTMSPRVGMLVNCIAVLFGAVMTVNLMWPRAAFYGPAWYQQYIAVIFVPAVALLGAVYYAISQRPTAAHEPEPAIAEPVIVATAPSD
jgi:urea carboxylase system permease